MMRSTKLWLAGLAAPFALPFSFNPTFAQDRPAQSARLLSANEVCAASCSMINPFGKCCDGSKWVIGTMCDETGGCPNDDCGGAS